MDTKSANLHSQNMVVSPKLILIAANNTTTGITTANTSRNSNTNNNASVSNPGIPNKPKVSDEGMMRFALMSSTESNKRNPAAAAASAQTSSDLVTDTGAIHVIVSWLPNPLAPAKESNAKVQFSDAMTSGPLNANVKYDLMILDKNGTTAVKKENLVAKNGLGTQTVTFPAKDVYQLEIKIITGRVKFIHWAISLCTVSALCVSIVIGTLFVGAATNLDVSMIITILFSAAMGCLIVGLLCFLREIMLTIGILQLEKRLDVSHIPMQQVRRLFQLSQELRD